MRGVPDLLPCREAEHFLKAHFCHHGDDDADDNADNGYNDADDGDEGDETDDAGSDVDSNSVT